jgi:hypothetical protein
MVLSLECTYLKSDSKACEISIFLFDLKDMTRIASKAVVAGGTFKTVAMNVQFAVVTSILKYAVKRDKNCPWLLGISDLSGRLALEHLSTGCTARESVADLSPS